MPSLYAAINMSLDFHALCPGVHRRAGRARPHRRLSRRHARRRQPAGKEGTDAEQVDFKF